MNEDVLIGHRIIEAEIREEGWHEQVAFLKLDNGTIVKVTGNEGCGGCSSGWYYVTQATTVDNIITNVEVVSESTDKYGEDFVYRIFVVTADEKIEAVTVEGSDGNGYYGSGFWIEVENESI